MNVEQCAECGVFMNRDEIDAAYFPELDEWMCGSCVRKGREDARIDAEAERDALRARAERMESGSCNCASVAPTYPTFRSDPHMPGCAFHRIDVLKTAIHASLERMGRLLALTRTEQDVESLLRAALAAAGEGEQA